MRMLETTPARLGLGRYLEASMATLDAAREYVARDYLYADPPQLQKDNQNEDRSNASVEIALGVYFLGAFSSRFAFRTQFRGMSNP